MSAAAAKKKRTLTCMHAEINVPEQCFMSTFINTQNTLKNTV